MLRVLFAASLAALLVGCASMPQPSVTKKAPVVKAKSVAKAAPVAQQAPEAKPPTFKERWFDRFMKHKSK